MNKEKTSAMNQSKLGIFCPLDAAVNLSFMLGQSLAHRLFMLGRLAFPKSLGILGEGGRGEGDPNINKFALTPLDPHPNWGCATGAEKASCGETVVQKGVFGESVSSLHPQGLQVF